MGLSRYYKFIAAGLVSAAVVIPSSTSTVAASSDWSQAAQNMAVVLPSLQRANGTFPAYNYAKASGELPYGEAMVGYGLVAHLSRIVTLNGREKLDCSA